MRVLVIVGILLAGLGGFILAGKVRLTTSEQVLDVGILKAEVQEKKPLPQWTGAVALAAGIGLILVGSRRRA